ncbi:MAG TPA: nucleotidyltransferase family protein [Gemmatimonadales bacterium]
MTVDRHGLGVERALYLLLAGARPGDPRLRRLVAGPVDWATLRALARRDGVTGELWRRLREGGATLPEEAAGAWEREARVADFHLLRLETRLGEVCRVLEGAGVRPVLIKGAGVAYTVHGGIRRRPMSDVDLLVEPGELERALEALEETGWRATAPETEYVAHHHAPPLQDPAGEGVIVELHHELVPGSPPFAFGADDVRRRAREVEAPWGSVVVPDPVDQLLHVAIHFAWSHELRWGAWRAFADVAALVRGEGSGGWLPQVRGRASRAGLERVLGWTLRLAGEVGGVTLPPEGVDMVRRGAPGRPALARHLAHQLLPGPGASPSVSLGRAAWELAVRPGGSGSAAGASSARPWRAGPPGGRPVAATLARRVGRQLARARDWVLYLRTVGRRDRGR